MLLIEVRGEEYRTVIPLGGIQHQVEALAPFAIVVHHWLNAQFVYGRKWRVEQAVEVGDLSLTVECLLVWDNLADILCVNGQKYSVAQTEQHRQNIVQNYALASTTVAHKHQAFVVGIAHPLDEEVIFGQVAVFGDCSIDIERYGRTRLCIVPYRPTSTATAHEVLVGGL